MSAGKRTYDSEWTTNFDNKRRLVIFENVRELFSDLELPHNRYLEKLKLDEDTDRVINIEVILHYYNLYKKHLCLVDMYKIREKHEKIIINTNAILEDLCVLKDKLQINALTTENEKLKKENEMLKKNYTHTPEEVHTPERTHTPEQAQSDYH